MGYIKGQLGGIEKMQEEGKDPEQVIIQLNVAEQALHKAHVLFLDWNFRSK